MKKCEIVRKNKKNLQKWVLVLAVFYLFSVLLRIPAATGIQAAHFGKLLVGTGLCFSMMLFLWNFSRRVVQFSLAIILLYVTIPYIGVFTGVNVSAAEILDAFCWGAEGISCILVLKYLFYLIKNKTVRMAGTGMTYILLLCVLWVPLVMLGYYLLNGQLITGDILLTLFQTNIHEAVSYIYDRGIVLWSIGIISIVLLCGIFVKLLGSLSAPPPEFS